jgi:hypothetical protein
MAKTQSVVAKARQRRDQLLKSRSHDNKPLSEEQRGAVLKLLRNGATLSEIFTMRGIASYGCFYATRTADQVFDDDVRKALAQGAEAAIAEAAELSRSAVETDNPDMMRIAEAFHRCALSYAEKAAPREYGQLIKLGGHDGGALSLSVVTYALPIVDGKFQELPDGSRARLISGEAEPLDAPT